MAIGKRTTERHRRKPVAGGDSGLLIGAKAIGEFLGVSEKTAFHLLETGAIVPAIKLGRRWALRKSSLELWLTMRERQRKPEKVTLDGRTRKALPL